MYKFLNQKKLETCYIKIKISVNNIFITLTDLEGKVLVSKHSGNLSYKGVRKKNPYAAARILGSLIYWALVKKKLIIKNYIIEFTGNVRNNLVRNICKQLDVMRNVKILAFKFKSTIAHNGLRPKKPRRI